VKFLQFDLGHQERGTDVQVTMSGNAANVLLLDSSNFAAFKNGRRHRYVGGQARRSPVRLRVPHSGRWHVVVHMGGLGGRVNASVRVLPKALPVMGTSGGSPLASIRDAAEDFASVSDYDSDQVLSEESGYDVFVSHAAEDKEAVVRPLAEALKARGVTVWYDEFELKVGDSLRRRIDGGLSASRFGVVVLSPAFFERGWPQYELDGLVTREVAGGRQLILPVWHGLSAEDVRRYSPSLADKVARSTESESIERIADEIAEVVRA
jgi:hypothetical protein